MVLATSVLEPPNRYFVNLFSFLESMVNYLQRESNLFLEARFHLNWSMSYIFLEFWAQAPLANSFNYLSLFHLFCVGHLDGLRPSRSHSIYSEPSACQALSLWTSNNQVGTFANFTYLPWGEGVIRCKQISQNMIHQGDGWAAFKRIVNSWQAHEGRMKWVLSCNT